MSKVSVRDAAVLTGKSRETINTATKEGTLSYSLNSRSHKVIDIAELERVYPLVKSMDELEKSKTVRDSQPKSESDRPDADSQIAILRAKLENLEQMNELLTQERQRERNHLEDEIDNLRVSLEKSQDQHSKAMLLITDQSSSKTNQWANAIKALETRISNQEEAAEEQKKRELLIRKKYRQKQAELEREKQKPFFKKLLGLS